MIKGVRASSIRMRVDLVDNGIIEGTPRWTIFETELHVVAKIIEAEFVVRAVGDVAGIGPRRAASSSIHGRSQPTVRPRNDELRPSIAIAPGQVIVNRNDMNAPARKGIQISAKVATSVLPSPVFISAILP